MKTLPKLRKSDCIDNFIRFWFNAEKNDYEVVEISFGGVTCSVSVYSLSCNSWKLISDTCPSRLRITETCLNSMITGDRSWVYARGTLHWLAYQMDSWTIVSLNMNNAKFQETSL